jgi:hypothetical protein
MSTILPAPMLSLLGELAESTRAIINRHWDEDAKKPELEQTLRYWEGFQVKVVTDDVVLAIFWDDGVELSPLEEK